MIEDIKKFIDYHMMSDPDKTDQERLEDRLRLIEHGAIVAIKRIYDEKMEDEDASDSLQE